MSNPFAGIITAELKTLFVNAIDSLLEDTACTVPCRIVYAGSKFTACINCIISPDTKRSTGKYKSGGPLPFTIGICPYCHGEGRVVQEATSTIYLLPLWDYRQWVNFNSFNARNMAIDGYIQTMSKIDTLTEIKKAASIIIDTELEPYKRHIFERVGEPNPLGFGDSSYLLTMWKANNG